MEAKEVVVEGFLRHPSLGSTNTSASTVNGGAGHDGLLDGICRLALALVWRTFWTCRGVTKRTLKLEVGEVGLDVFVEHDELMERDIVCVLEEHLVAVVLDDLLGERQVVLALMVRTSE